ncbi:hypothetical protein [Streptomyces niveus]|uniref:hypothetical protein n=1 Tax=Streptomyces niveus TaxID=193462 RepID=UPI00366A140A
MSETETQLQARGAAYAREYASIESKQGVLADSLALVCLALRVQMQDMTGTSYEYKQTIRELYSQSDVTGDQLTRLQANVRYHLGNRLRRHMTPRELEKHGLLPSSPLERGQDKRSRNAALVAALNASDTDKPAPKSKAKASDEGASASSTPAVSGRAVADHLRLGQGAARVLEQLDADVIASMTAGQRAKLDEELETIQTIVRALRRAVKRASSER